MIDQQNENTAKKVMSSARSATLLIATIASPTLILALTTHLIGQTATVLGAIFGGILYFPIKKGLDKLIEGRKVTSEEEASSKAARALRISAGIGFGLLLAESLIASNYTLSTSTALVAFSAVALFGAFIIFASSYYYATDPKTPAAVNINADSDVVTHEPSDQLGSELDERLLRQNENAPSSDQHHNNNQEKSVWQSSFVQFSPAKQGQGVEMQPVLVLGKAASLGQTPSGDE